jgi:hypothetical protein
MAQAGKYWKGFQSCFSEKKWYQKIPSGRFKVKSSNVHCRADFSDEFRKWIRDFGLCGILSLTSLILRTTTFQQRFTLMSKSHFVGQTELFHMIGYYPKRLCLPTIFILCPK